MPPRSRGSLADSGQLHEHGAEEGEPAASASAPGCPLGQAPGAGAQGQTGAPGLTPGGPSQPSPPAAGPSTCPPAVSRDAAPTAPPQHPLLLLGFSRQPPERLRSGASLRLHVPPLMPDDLEHPSMCWWRLCGIFREMSGEGLCSFPHELVVVFYTLAAAAHQRRGLQTRPPTL